MDALDLQIRILDHIRLVPWRGSFPQLLKVLGLELTDMETAAHIATHIHNPDFLAELYGKWNIAMWCGTDGNWRVIDLVDLKAHRMSRWCCSLCRIEEDDKSELIKASNGSWVHPLCLPHFERRLEEEILNV